MGLGAIFKQGSRMGEIEQTLRVSQKPGEFLLPTL